MERRLGLRLRARLGLRLRARPVEGDSFCPRDPRTNSPPWGPRKIRRPLASLRPVGVFLSILLGGIVCIRIRKIFF
jgi:hypothetical protein